LDPTKREKGEKKGVDQKKKGAEGDGSQGRSWGKKKGPSRMEGRVDDMGRVND
jgi:hypothetical protein